MNKKLEVKSNEDVILDKILGIKLNLNEIESIRFVVPKLTCADTAYKYFLEIDDLRIELERIISNKDAKVHFKPLYHGGYKILFKMVFDGDKILFYVNFYKGKRLQSQWILEHTYLTDYLLKFIGNLDGTWLSQGRKVEVVWNDWLDEEIDSAFKLQNVA